MAWKGFFGWQIPQQPSSAQESANAQVHLLAELSELLGAHRQRLNALRLESGFAAELFERLIGAVLYNCAEYVHLLPATREEHHAEPGGLFRLALESASLALRCAEGKFLGAAASTPMQDRERDRVRRYAAFLSGLLLPLGRCATHLHVFVHGRKELWNPYQEPILVWSRRVDADKLDIQWRRTDAQSAQAAAIWIAARIVPLAALNYLQSAEDSLEEKLLQVLSGDLTAGRLGEIVRQAYQGAIDQDLTRLGLVPRPRDTPKQSTDAVKLLEVERLGLQIERTAATEVEIAVANATPAVLAQPENTPFIAVQAPHSSAIAAVSATPAQEIVPDQPSPEPAGVDAAGDIVEGRAVDLKPLDRFGEAGRVLKALAQRLLAEPNSANKVAQVVAVEGGVAIAYPQAIASFCQHPQQFLLACEAQGLLVADNGAGRRMLRTRAPGQSNLPEQYVVLSARVAKYLPLRTDTAT